MQRLPLQSRVTKRDEQRRGAAMVEFAITAPLFLLLIVGTIEIGNALEATTQLGSALREAGRLASMDWTGLINDGDSPNDKVVRDIRSFLTAAGYSGDQVMITITSADGSDMGQPFDLGNPANERRLFKIEASIPYEEISTFPHGYMKGRDISANLVMRSGRVSLMN